MKFASVLLVASASAVTVQRSFDQLDPSSAGPWTAQPWRYNQWGYQSPANAQPYGTPPPAAPTGHAALKVGDRAAETDPVIASPYNHGARNADTIANVYHYDRTDQNVQGGFTAHRGYLMLDSEEDPKTAGGDATTKN